MLNESIWNHDHVRVSTKNLTPKKAPVSDILYVYFHMTEPPSGHNNHVGWMDRSTNHWVVMHEVDVQQLLNHNQVVIVINMSDVDLKHGLVL